LHEEDLLDAIFTEHARQIQLVVSVYETNVKVIQTELMLTWIILSFCRHRLFSKYKIIFWNKTDDIFRWFKVLFLFYYAPSNVYF